jgi:hypothetical protein
MEALNYMVSQDWFELPTFPLGRVGWSIQELTNLAINVFRLFSPSQCHLFPKDC